MSRSGSTQDFVTTGWVVLLGAVSLFAGITVVLIWVALARGGASPWWNAVSALGSVLQSIVVFGALMFAFVELRFNAGNARSVRQNQVFDALISVSVAEVTPAVTGLITLATKLCCLGERALLEDNGEPKTCSATEYARVLDSFGQTVSSAEMSLARLQAVLVSAPGVVNVDVVTAISSQWKTLRDVPTSADQWSQNNILAVRNATAALDVGLTDLYAAVGSVNL